MRYSDIRENEAVRSWMTSFFITVLAVMVVPFLVLPAILPAQRAALVPPVAEAGQGVWLTGSTPLAYNLPSGPYDEQRRPPCGAGQRVIRGGCWIALEARPYGAPPSCDEGAPHEGKCWIPVHKSNVPRTSINRR